MLQASTHNIFVATSLNITSLIRTLEHKSRGEFHHLFEKQCIRQAYSSLIFQDTLNARWKQQRGECEYKSGTLLTKLYQVSSSVPPGIHKNGLRGLCRAEVPPALTSWHHPSGVTLRYAHNKTPRRATVLIFLWIHSDNLFSSLFFLSLNNFSIYPLQIQQNMNFYVYLLTSTIVDETRYTAILLHCRVKVWFILIYFEGHYTWGKKMPILF
jgi:hypothetical protein